MLVQCLTLIFSALCLCMLGVVLYFKRMCMVANSLSHTTLLGVILAYLILGQSIQELSLNPLSLFIGALLSSFLTLFLQKICQRVLKAQDASIGFIFTLLFAVSILLISVFAKHTHISQEVIMGSLEFVQSQELGLSIFLFIILAAFLFVFYSPTRAASFDKEFFALSFRRSWLFEFVLIMITSLVITLCFRMIGVVAILGFLTAPVFIAKLVARSFVSLILIAALCSISSSLFCFVSSRILYQLFYLALPINALVVVFMSLLYLFIKEKNLILKF